MIVEVMGGGGEMRVAVVTSSHWKMGRIVDEMTAAVKMRSLVSLRNSISRTNRVMSFLGFSSEDLPVTLM